MAAPPAPRLPRADERQIGRYILGPQIAAGGMASVHLGRLVGAIGFSRPVAIKRMHPHFLRHPNFVAMFADEARLAARVRHPNVVTTLDVVSEDDELFLVLELHVGESLSKTLRRVHDTGRKMPLTIASGIITQVLLGLHAAHEAVSERGEPLGIVHRDVSPQNILLAEDGVALVLDFGVAKAESRIQETRDGEVKGKIWYMSPEQLEEKRVDRRSDVFSAAMVLWELCVGRRLISAETAAGATRQVALGKFASPSEASPGLTRLLDPVVMRGLSRDPSQRWATARDMALALEDAVPPASTQEIRAWLRDTIGDRLEARAKMIAAFEADADTGAPAFDPMTRSEAPTVISHEGRRSEVTQIKHRTLALAVGLATSIVVVIGSLVAYRLLRADPENAGSLRTFGAWVALVPPRRGVPAAPSEAPLPQPSEKLTPPETKPKVPPVTGPRNDRGGPPSVKAGNCDVPYFIQDGVKRYRPECL